MPARYPNAVGTSLIREFTGVLAETVATHDLATPVTTCGEWSLADLALHLSEVQTFWAHIIDNRPAGPEGYVRPERSVQPERSVGADLAARLRDGVALLADALDRSHPSDEAWSWSEDHTVAFSIRRQTHEAHVHLVDGLLACGLPLPDFEATIGADGVDEMLTHMIGGMPPWATFEPSGESFALECSDTGDRWALQLGQLKGIEPVSGQALELWAVASGGDPAAVVTTVRAPAIDLDLWLWGRLPFDRVDVVGEQTHASAIREYVAIATQ